MAVLGQRLPPGNVATRLIPGLSKVVRAERKARWSSTKITRTWVGSSSLRLQWLKQALAAGAVGRLPGGAQRSPAEM